MTDKEKLDVCVKFIEQMMSFDDSAYDEFDLSDIECDCECNECGSNDVDVEKYMPRGVRCADKYISTRAIDDIRDTAWHAWANIQT